MRLKGGTLEKGELVEGEVLIERGRIQEGELNDPASNCECSLSSAPSGMIYSSSFRK